MKNKTIISIVSIVAIATAIYFLTKKKGNLKLIDESVMDTAENAGRIALAKKLYESYKSDYGKKSIVSKYTTGLTLYDVDESMSEQKGTKIDPFSANRALDVSNPYLFRITSDGFIKLYFITNGQRKMYYFSPYAFKVE